MHSHMYIYIRQFTVLQYKPFGFTRKKYVYTCVCACTVDIYIILSFCNFHIYQPARIYHIMCKNTYCVLTQIFWSASSTLFF